MGRCRSAGVAGLNRNVDLAPGGHLEAVGLGVQAGSVVAVCRRVVGGRCTLLGSGITPNDTAVAGDRTAGRIRVPNLSGSRNRGRFSSGGGGFLTEIHPTYIHN